MTRIFVAGYPGDVGGANTELWHTILLWREAGWDVDLIPTWGHDEPYEQKLRELGCRTWHVTKDQLHLIDGLAGSHVVSFCNGEFIKALGEFRSLGCRVAWANCMTFLFPAELDAFAKNGPPDVMVYQSEFQRSQLEPQVKSPGVVTRGAFSAAEWPHQPREHEGFEPFWVGRCARPDLDKWSSNTLKILESVAYPHKRAILLGMDDRTIKKLGSPPWWVEYLRPRQISAQTLMSRLHAYVSINGGAKENWPRVGLEAMASGVPLVVEDKWGWREMVEHRVTGYRCNSDEEFAHYTALLAYDETHRLDLIDAAYEHFKRLTDAGTFITAWEKVCSLLS